MQYTYIRSYIFSPLLKVSSKANRVITTKHIFFITLLILWCDIEKKNGIGLTLMLICYLFLESYYPSNCYVIPRKKHNIMNIY